MPSISIAWDFDGTLTPNDSTSLVVEKLDRSSSHKDFWALVKSLKGVSRKPDWRHILAMDAPIWMYTLSRIAFREKVPLNAEFFRKFVLHDIKLYDGVLEFLRELKNLGNLPQFKEVDLKVHHFIVTAGLKELVEQVFPAELVTFTFGCRYTIVVDKYHKDEPESVPVFCVDETGKTRSIFEISKGSFQYEDREVNTRVEENDRFSPFSNMIYIGDGDTDIPSLSLVRHNGGVGIVVYNKETPIRDVERKLHRIRADKRADFITSSDFSASSELYKYIRARCFQIMHKYHAERIAVQQRRN